jgi:hypothetical protein
LGGLCASKDRDKWMRYACISIIFVPSIEC